MKKKFVLLTMGIVALFAIKTFASYPIGSTCTLDISGSCHCVALVDENNNTTGYRCDSGSGTSKCVCP